MAQPSERDPYPSETCPRAFDEWKPFVPDILNPEAAEVDWLIKPFIPVGASCLLSADKKTGKTMFLYRLALDAAKGEPPVGHYSLQHGPIKVLIIQNELQEPEDNRRWRKVAQGAGYELEEVQEAFKDGRTTVFNHPLGFTLTDQEHARWLQDRIADSGANLVIVDSLIASFSGVDLNNNADMRNAMKALDPIIGSGVSVVLIHHTRKLNQNERRDHGSSSHLGAQYIGAAVGVIYTVERVPLQSPDVDRNEFAVRIVPGGSWAPEDRPVEFRIWDSEGGTGIHIEPLDTDRAREPKNVRGARRIAQLVAEKGGLDRTAVEAHLKSEGFSGGTYKKCQTTAEARGWIAKEQLPGAGRAVRFFPGPNADELVGASPSSTDERPANGPDRSAH